MTMAIAAARRKASDRLMWQCAKQWVLARETPAGLVNVSMVTTFVTNSLASARNAREAGIQPL
jgi:hypothetical protein